MQMRKSMFYLFMTGLLLSAWIPAAVTASPDPVFKSIRIKGNYVALGNRPGRLAYKSAGDLNGDGRTETVYSVMLGCAAFYTVVAHQVQHGWSIISIESSGYGFSRADVADVNGDGKLEVVVRSMSGDGHDICFIYILKERKLVNIGQNYNDFFGLTRFADIDHDGKLEVLSITDPAFGFQGDFWLTIYKWNGAHYVDVSDRFPTQYDKVITRIRKMIYRSQYTNYYGHPENPDHNPAFGALYYQLGRAYELRRQPNEARVQYAIAYRLDPNTDWIADAFRRTWRLARKKN